jgi:hypothetical protein
MSTLRMKQCKATSSRCERYPFLAYCHFSATGWVQRCDFDTLAECKASPSEFDGYCGRSPWLTTPEAPTAINLNQGSRSSGGEAEVAKLHRWKRYLNFHCVNSEQERIE